MPSFEAMLGTLERALVAAKELNVKIRGRTPYALKIAVGAGFEFDLLVAPDLAGKSPQNPEKQQLAALLHKIWTTDEDTRRYRSAFSESVVSFFKRQPESINCLIRLCKFWSKSLNFTHVHAPPSLSYMCELVAVHCGANLHDGSVPSLEASFESFLKEMANYKNMNIFWFEEYKEGHVQNGILSQRPLILEPVNPTNNICASFSPSQWEVIAASARESLIAARLHGANLPVATVSAALQQSAEEIKKLEVFANHAS